MLTLEEKYQVVFALCHNAKILDDDSTHYNSVFNDRLNNLNDIVSDKVRELLDKIYIAEERVESSPLKDNVKQIGDIHLDTNHSKSLKTTELNRLRGQLSQLLDVPNKCRAGGVGCFGVCR